MKAEPPVFDVVLLTPSGEHAIRVRGDEHIWGAAHAAGISLPALCHQGYCLTCAGLLCTGKPRSALRIRTHQQKQMREHRKQHKLLAPYSWSKD